MPELRAAGEFGGSGEAPAGPGAVGAGVDVVAELERVRSNLVALAAIVEELRARYNTHTHDANVVAPPSGEQAPVAMTLG